MKDSDKDAENEQNYTRLVFYTVLKKKLPSWAEALEFAKVNNIPQGTMSDAYYKEGKVGIQAIDDILKKLLKITPEKLASVMDAIHNLDPISESTKIFNSIDAPEMDKRRFALFSKAMWDIENQIKKS